MVFQISSFRGWQKNAGLLLMYVFLSNFSNPFPNDLIDISEIWFTAMPNQLNIKVDMLDVLTDCQ